ncbi:RNA-guided endonuclease TnpB family protein [Streptomyces sp. NPDC002643]
MLLHCAHARYVWNLAVEQHTHWRRWRKPAPGFAEQCRQLTEARRDNEWLGAGNADVQQQALKDFTKAKKARFTSGFGEPTWRRKFRHEGFRVIKVPGCGWVRLSVKGKGALLPEAKTFRVTFRNGQWHIAFAVIPEPTPAPGTGKVIGIDRGVTITAALSDGRTLNCPQLTVKQRAQIRKHQRRAARAKKGSPEKAAEYAKAAKLKAREVNRRKDWCEKTSTMLARDYDLIRFEKLNIKNMTRSAKGTVEQPGTNVAQKSGLNRAILAQGWGLLRQRTEHKAPGRVRDVPAPYTSLRCSACWGHLPRPQGSGGGPTRTRARAKPSSSVFPAASPATRTPTRVSTSRQDRAGFPAPGAQPVPEGRHRPPSGRASVNLNPTGLESPSFKRGRMSILEHPDRHHPPPPPHRAAHPRHRSPRRRHPPRQRPGLAPRPVDADTGRGRGREARGGRGREARGGRPPRKAP